MSEITVSVKNEGVDSINFASLGQGVDEHFYSVYPFVSGFPSTA